MVKQKIFFSYSRADGSEFALRLATDLKNRGFDVWIDQEDIRPGREWDAEIEKALKGCDCLLFLETERSVASTNVLDEVYYALEQKKKVIPLVYVDSLTPFRLNRLQHIDFTKNYATGLTQLVKELEGQTLTENYAIEEPTPLPAHRQVFNRKNTWVFVTIFCVAVAIIAVIVLTTKSKNSLSAASRERIVITDTLAGKTENAGKVLDTTMVSIQEEEGSKSKDIISPTKDKKQVFPKSSTAPGSVQTKTIGSSSARKENNLNEMVAGDWKLMDMEPTAQTHRGYLKIEALDENKATIKSYVQFYYPDSKASSYLTIFNAFAGCTSCAVNKEMKLKVEDIAVGSRTIKKLEKDQPDGGKAGDVILDANSNKSIIGTVTLQFVDNNNAVIKVKQPITIALANDLMLEPFVYTFRFKKSE